jgi:hypothetical protein
MEIARANGSIRQAVVAVALAASLIGAAGTSATAFLHPDPEPGGTLATSATGCRGHAAGDPPATRDGTRGGWGSPRIGPLPD